MHGTLDSLSPTPHAVHRTVQAAPAWTRPMLRRLNSLWRNGILVLTLPNGAVLRVGAEGSNEQVVWNVRRWGAFGRLLVRGDIGFAEGYISGDWDSPDLTSMMVAFADNYDALGNMVSGHFCIRILNAMNHALAHNSRKGAQRNIMAHYDLGNDFYREWLDPGMTYSAALYENPKLTLEQAQFAKNAALAKSADIRAGHSVLEIGCGWGGFSEFAAKEIGATVTAVTLSPSQRDYAQRRMFEQGLADKVQIKLIDYRDVQGAFDRVASVEMFEAVGEAYWPTYFGKIDSLLKDDGRAGLQIITIRETLFEAYRKRPDFIQMHVFPGGMLPTEQRLDTVVREAGMVGKIERRFGLDYARTLKEWHATFESRWPNVAKQGFDDRFRRLWRYYLSYCEAGFRSARTDVVHMTLQKA